MDAHMLYLAFIALGLTATVAVPATSLPEFTEYSKALDIVHANKGTINDAVFCVEVESGMTKIACRMKELPAFGFLYCQREPSCFNYISVELNALITLRDADVKTVDFYPHVITDVLCPGTKNRKCSGLIQKWENEAVPIRFLSGIRISDAESYSEDLISITISPAALLTTATDLKHIREYITENAMSKKSYNQIVDLQGFARKRGGFLVNDPGGLRSVVKPDLCVESILTAITIMIAKLEEASKLH